MFTDANIIAIGLGAIGGFCFNMMNVFEDSKRPKYRRTTKDVIYLVMFLFWPFAGALLVFVSILEGSTIKPITALIVGLTSPSILKRLLEASTDEYGPIEGDDVEN